MYILVVSYAQAAAIPCFYSLAKWKSSSIMPCKSSFYKRKWLLVVLLYTLPWFCDIFYAVINCELMSLRILVSILPSAFVAYYYSLYYHCSWFKVHAIQNIIWNIKWVIFISLETVAIDTIKKCPIRKTFASKKKINYLAGHAEINFTSLKYFELQTRDTLTDIN